LRREIATSNEPKNYDQSKSSVTGIKYLSRLFMGQRKSSQ